MDLAISSPCSSQCKIYLQVRVLYYSSSQIKMLDKPLYRRYILIEYILFSHLRVWYLLTNMVFVMLHFYWE